MVTLLTIGNEIAIVPLTQGQRAVIDVIDIPVIAPFLWTAMRCSQKRTWYAGRSGSRRNAPRQANVMMHRLITGAKEYVNKVDHRDGDGLNNRRENLRITTHQINMINCHTRPFGKSKFRGVVWNRGKWQAQISVNNRKHHAGRFDVEEDAARAYDAAAILHHGIDARLNFPRTDGATLLGS